MEDSHFIEWRIHGVGDPPPASILGMEPQLIDPRSDPCGRPVVDSLLQVHAQPEPRPDLRAFSWSSLPAGTLSTLLLPFALANIAGWMMLPNDPDPPSLGNRERARGYAVRSITLLVRLLGLLVSVALALFAFLTLVDLIGYQVLVRDRNYSWAWTMAIGVGATAVVVFATSAKARIRQRTDALIIRPWEDKVDPVGYAWLHKGQVDMWNRPGIIVRLNRLHLAAALAAQALVASAISYRLPGGEVGDAAAFVVALFACLLPVLLISVITLNDGRRVPEWSDPWVRWVSWTLSLGALCAAAARLAGDDGPQGFGEFLPVIRGSMGWVALTFSLLMVATALLNHGARIREQTPRQGSWNQPALIIAAGASVAAIGSGLAFQASRLANSLCQRAREGNRCFATVGSEFDWFAIGFTWVVTILVLMLCVRFVWVYQTQTRLSGRARRRGGASGLNRRTTMVTVSILTSNASQLLKGVVCTAASAIVGAIVGLQLLDYSTPPRIWEPISIASSIALLVPLLVLLIFSIISFALQRAWTFVELVAAMVVTAVGVFALILMSRFHLSIPLLGFQVPPSSFLGLAQLVALLVPTTPLLSRILSGGARARTAERGLGVAWDLSGFWPRWFHPWAPPTYSDRAVTYLIEIIDTHAARGKRQLMSAHSQGSILAAAAILGSRAPQLHTLALLTYGSPWSRLYAQLFPASFSPTCLVNLCERLRIDSASPLRWRNLFRETDPIGGPIRCLAPYSSDDFSKALDLVNCGPFQDPCGRLHSRYDAEEQFADKAAELRAMIGASC